MPKVPPRGPVGPAGPTFLARLWETRPRGRASWLILGLLVVVVSGTTYYLRQKQLTKTSLMPSTKVEMEPQMELKFDEVVMRGRDKGTARWEIRVPEMNVSENQRVVYFKDHPKGKFLNLKDWSDKPDKEKRNRSVDWVADSAQYDNDFQELSIKGNGVFTTDEKDVMKTDNVTYRQRDNLVMVNSPFKFDSHDHKLQMKGDVATADTKLEILEMGGKVVVDSKLSESDKL
jgi:hypothetical protein